MPRIVLCLSLLLLAARAAAQTAPVIVGLEESPTRGVLQPGAGPADGPEPFAVTLNPAALGELQGLSLGLRHSELSGDDALNGRGSALYLASPVPYLRRLQLGGALELLRPTGQAAVYAGDLAGRLVLSLSALLVHSPHGGLSLGLSYSHLFTAPAAPAAGLNTVDVGVRIHSGRYLALGAVLRDLNAPTLAGGAALQRSYDVELLTRPAGDDRVELAGGARIGEQRGDVAPRARLLLRPARGLAIGADAEVLAGTPQRALDWRVALGVHLDFAQAGGSLYGLVNGGDPGVAFGGGALALRVSAERYPSLWEGPPDVLYRVEPGDLGGSAFLRLLLALRRVESDGRARGVILLFSDLHVGWGRAAELRDALTRLRRAGKRVYIYSADLSTKSYYVASAADHLFLDPAGSLRVTGVALQSFFVREALDNLGLHADLLRVGDYKSAPETFLRSGPSEAARAQRQTLADDLYERVRAAVASGRHLSPAAADALMERGVFTPRAAAAAHLVDSIATEDQVETGLVALLGAAPRLLPLPALPGEAALSARGRSFSQKTVAIINLEGDMLPGDSLRVPLLGVSVLGLRSVLAALHEAAADPQVQAVVLRVETPGGSAEAADIIAREIGRLRRRLPVVCSFGDVAASGGYYLAAPCDRIYASAGTVTGSIGIFGGKVDVAALARRLGVVSLSAVRGTHADMQDSFRPYTPEERALVQEQLQAGYDRFLDVVSAGRRLPRAQVEAVAGGRVFTGPRAVAARLCDEIGGLADAVAEARGRAGLPPTQAGDDIALRFYPRSEVSPLSRLLALLGLGIPGLTAADREARSAAVIDTADAVLPAPLRALLRDLGMPALLTTALLNAGGALARMEGTLPQ